MQVTTEKLDKKQVEITIEVDEKQFEEGLQHAYKKLLPKINVPGFRKGKVPRKIIEQRFGTEALFEDAVDYIIPKAYFEALNSLDESIVPVGRPDIDIIQLEKEKPFIFKAKVEIKPEVILGEYKGLELEKIDTNVTEEQISQDLENLRQKHAQLEVLTGEEQVEKGDNVILDFVGKLEGIPFEGGTAEDYALEIGSGSFIPGFEEQLEGMKIEEEKEINVKFPDEYHSKDLAGKPAVFEVKIKEIKRKKLAELDDEFAKDVSEFETLQELKDDVANKLKKNKEEVGKAQLKAQAAEKAAANTEIDIPEAMIDNQIDTIIQDFDYRLRMQGLSLEKYLEFSKETMESIRDKYKAEAEKTVKEQLVLEAIAKEEDIKVEDSDLEGEIEKIAEAYKQEKEKVKDLLEKQGQIESVKHSLIIDKAIDLIIENAKLD